VDSITSCLRLRPRVAGDAVTGVGDLVPVGLREGREEVGVLLGRLVVGVLLGKLVEGDFVGTLGRGLAVGRDVDGASDGCHVICWLGATVRLLGELLGDALGADVNGNRLGWEIVGLRLDLSRVGLLEGLALVELKEGC
jgi:hypothetical protein